MSALAQAIEDLQQRYGVTFLLAVNEEGLSVAEAGEVPPDGFAAYLPMAMETGIRMAYSGGMGDPVCMAFVLPKGGMLILARAELEGQAMYLAIRCRRPPKGLRRLIEEVTASLRQALGISAKGDADAGS